MIRVLMLLIILGVVAYLIRFLPLPEPFPTLIYGCMILVVIWEVLAMAGYVPSAVGRWRQLPP